MSKVKKNIMVVKCDNCGKENRIKKNNLREKAIEAINNNVGCYCSKCSSINRNEKQKFSYEIMIGEPFTVYPKKVDVEHIKGVNRAKNILERGLQQLKQEGK
ncbi:hypothetical protein RBH29_14875 [Herbivorax sp. ANBcel31]|uniref:hypothetical protein n=1 Tax=Herbivorax sp. ANBcel31 TaxID=3069754 RepID=UPI0027AEE530|nr:hypothetical protein [Herbivorax sp. ANBcel31]MDQ2087711.1 hypothetical protein [Herbivorax sp. ANBcel31]